PACACSARPSRPVHLTPVCPARLLDHLIGQQEQGWRDHDSQRLGGLEVDHQLKFGRLLYREIGRLRTLENLVHTDGGAAIVLGDGWSIGHQPPSLYHLSPVIHRRQTVFGSEVRRLSAQPWEQQRVLQHEERVHTCLAYRRKGTVQFVRTVQFHDV